MMNIPIEAVNLDRLIEERLDYLAELCRKYHVRRIEIFGSALTPNSVASTMFAGSRYLVLLLRIDSTHNPAI